MNPSQANSREYQRQAIDAEIKVLEASLRALKLRRNALAPVSSLPTEVITAIFSFLRVSSRESTSFTLAEKPDPLAWLHTAHVCHRWREMALSQPLFWSYINLTTFNSAGAAEILARAKTVPLYLEARVPIGHWDNARFSAFQKDLQDRVSHICHLGISAESFNLRKTLKGLVSPAPALEYLSLSAEEYRNGTIQPRVFVPNTLFDGFTPRLSCLELCNCDFSLKSPLLRGLKHLEIRTLLSRPDLSDWLDALDEMPQLKTLALHWASPNAPSLPFDVKRTVTLPSLTRFDISASVVNCALALAHLVLPALTSLCVTARTCRWICGDVQEIFSYVARHAHGPQDTQPLQSVLICGESSRVDILAWTVPDIDIEVGDRITVLGAIPSARVAFSITRKTLLVPDNYIGVFDAAMAALPLDSLVTLTVQKDTRLDEQSWLRHAPSLPLLQRVRLAPPAARGFTEMILNDNGGRESPLLPSLTKLVLVYTGLSGRRIFRLCDALMKRVEQGVPLEVLDLRTCVVTNNALAVQLLSEIVVDVWGSEGIVQTGGQMCSTWGSAAHDLLFGYDSSEVEDSDTYSGSGDDNWENWGVDDDEDEFDENEAEY